jgi:hypothetical protein
MPRFGFLSSVFTVEWNQATDSLDIVHPDPALARRPLIAIPGATLRSMTLTEASEFVGSRLILSIPQLRQQWVDDTTDPPTFNENPNA